VVLCVDGEVLLLTVGIVGFDRSILSILQDDARTSFTKIAQQLGVSDATIHLRVKKMEGIGLIEKYILVINEEKMGKPVTHYVLIRVDSGSVEDVCTKLMELEDVYEICEIHERYGVLVKIRGDSLDEVRDILIQKLRSIQDIAGSEVYTVYKTWKRDFGGRRDGLKEKLRWRVVRDQ